METLLRTVRLLSASVIVALCAACGRLGDISVEKWSLTSLEPLGSGSLAVTIQATISNRGPQIEVQSLEGVILHDGRPLGDFTAEGFSIAGRTAERTSVRVTLNPDKGFPPLEALMLFRNFDISRFTVSFTAGVRTGAVKTRIKKEDVPLEVFVRL